LRAVAPSGSFEHASNTPETWARARAVTAQPPHTATQTKKVHIRAKTYVRMTHTHIYAHAHTHTHAHTTLTQRPCYSFDDRIFVHTKQTCERRTDKRTAQQAKVKIQQTQTKPTDHNHQQSLGSTKEHYSQRNKKKPTKTHQQTKKHTSKQTNERTNKYQTTNTTQHTASPPPTII